MATSKTTTTKKTTTTAKRNNRKHRKPVDVYQTVTDAIVKQIEEGLNGSWRRPWVAAP